MKRADPDIDRLLHPASHVRLAAIPSARLDGPQAELLISLVGSDSSARVRLAALHRLSAGDADLLVRGASAALGVDDEQLRAEAVRLLPLDHAPSLAAVASALRDPSPVVSGAAAARLASSGTPAAVCLLWCALPTAPPNATEEILSGLQMHVPPAARALAIHGVSSSDPNVRAWGAAVLARIGHLEDQGHVLRALVDPVAEVRVAAVRHLRQPLTDRELAAVGTRVHDPDGSVRTVAVQALAASDDDRACDYLLAAARDVSPQIRTLAQGALLQRCSPYLIRLLLRSLGEPRFRRAALELLSQTGDVVIPVASEELPSLDDASREALAEALSSEPLLSLLLEALRAPYPDERMRALALVCLVSTSRVVEPLVELLYDPSPQIRKTVARRLGELGDDAALQPLRQAFVAEPDLDLVPVVEQAVRSLARPSSRADPDPPEPGGQVP